LQKSVDYIKELKLQCEQLTIQNQKLQAELNLRIAGETVAHPIIKAEETDASVLKPVVDDDPSSSTSTISLPLPSRGVDAPTLNLFHPSHTIPKSI
jgi:hypothetical protein